MKDIDFDELDRAVSSLMTKSTAKPDASPQVSDASTTSSDTGTTPKEVIDPPLATPEPTRIAAVSPAASRSSVTPPRRGRFMDMVSAKKPQTVNDVTQRPITVAARPVAAPPSVKPNQPDSDKSDDQSTSVGATADNPQTESAFESPFLFDAKVQKRPLNASVANGSVESVDELTNNKTLAEESEVESPVDSQLAELESESMRHPEAAGSSAKDSAENNAVPADHRLDKGDSDTAPARLTPASISQQYKEQPNTGDQTHTPIYDTVQFAPEPLTHPVKKKTGWLWVLWVILLLGLGAGGAIALYVLGII